jgi:hypothetical protein
MWWKSTNSKEAATSKQATKAANSRRSHFLRRCMVLEPGSGPSMGVFKNM